MSTTRRPSRLLLLLLGAGLAVVAAGFAFAHRARGASHTGPLRSGVVVIDTNLGFQGGRAAGTGMILTPSGEVLTNNHVIAGATTVRVVVPQTGRSYPATVVGYDVTADTALLRLRGASNLPTVTLGDSSRLALGQSVRAIGNAGGTGRLTAARGRVTALDRTITVSNDEGQTQRLGGLVETNAPLQPGDSGGPLLDGSDRVVGMDTAVSTAGQGFLFSTPTNDAYSIPIDTALRVVKAIEAGHATATVHIGATAFLGIELAGPGDGYGYGGASPGVLVAGVVTGSPADRAGLAYGDVITRVAGRTVATPKAVVDLVSRRRPGSTVRIAWATPYGASQTSTVRLGSGPPQ